MSRVLRGRKNEDGEQQEATSALDLLHSDHEEVSGLFEQALSDDTPAAQRRSTIAKIVQALTVHAKMEEALFYPALRRAGGSEERDSVLEANEEHGMVKDMLAKIERSTGRDETMTAKVKVLKEMVLHHVHEEESTIFDEARKTLGEDRLRKIGAEMMRFKENAMRQTRAGSRGARGNGARKTAAKRNGSTRKSSTKRATARKTRRG